MNLKGWTNEGQNRGCYVLHPHGDRATVIRVKEQNKALEAENKKILERLEALEQALVSKKKK